MKKILIILSLFYLFGCNNTETKKYEVAYNVKYSILDRIYDDEKDLIKIYAYLLTDTFTKEDLNKWLLEMKSLSSRKMTYIYLYQSQNLAINEKSNFIAMFSRTPSDEKDNISFNDFRMDAVNDKLDTLESNDEKMEKYLIDYLKQRGTNYCDFAIMDNELYDKSIKEADDKYPGLGSIKRTNYQSSIYKRDRKELFKKYKVNDTMDSWISAFYLTKCK